MAADREITWQGLTIGGQSGYDVIELTGWDELPGTNDLSEPRVRAHGDHPGPLYGQGRTVTVTGEIRDNGTSIGRDALFQQLMAVTPLSSDLTDLSINLFGQSLTAQARIIRRALNPGALFSAGVVPFALQWRCPDPLRYGLERVSTAYLPVVSGGLAYPLAYPLGYGTAGTPGQLTLDNVGTADAPIVFTVNGSLPLGFELSAAGRRLTYSNVVPSGQPVVIDTGAGTALVEGTADRRSELTNADWLVVPAGSSLTVQFTSLGGTYDPAAYVSAACKPAFW